MTRIPVIIRVDMHQSAFCISFRDLVLTRKDLKILSTMLNYLIESIQTEIKLVRYFPSKNTISRPSARGVERAAVRSDGVWRRVASVLQC